MQLGAFLCERKNNVDVYYPAVYCFTIGFKLLTIMKWEMLLLKVISQSFCVKNFRNVSIVGELGMDWLVWSEYIGNWFQSVTISRVKGQKAPSLSSLFFHISSLTFKTPLTIAWKSRVRIRLTNHWVKLQSRKSHCITLYFFYQYKSNDHKSSKNLPDLPDAITLRLIIMKNHFRLESKFKYQQSSHK